MKYCSFYRLSDGLFTGTVRGVSVSRRVEDVVVPNGCGMVEGRQDHLSTRVDLVSGKIVDYQPPQPDADHEWVHDDDSGNRVRRWVLKQEVVLRRLRRQNAVTEIDSLERLQVRSISELIADPNATAARANFERRKARIDELRSVISETETTAPGSPPRSPRDPS